MESVPKETITQYHSTLEKMENLSSIKLNIVYYSLLEASLKKDEGLVSNNLNRENLCSVLENPNQNLNKIIELYFQTENIEDFPLISTSLSLSSSQLNELNTHLKIFIYDNLESIQSGRNCANIFYGISTPNFSAEKWRSNQFWGRYLKYDFKTIVEIAEKEIQIINKLKKLDNL